MPSLHLLLEKYDTILFDLDGVITNEEIYWNIAALTVWEVCESQGYFGNNLLNYTRLAQDHLAIRETVFCRDKTVALLKNKGINNNWDLTWVTVSGALILGTKDFNEVYQWAETLPTVEEGLCARVSHGLKQVLPEEDVEHGGAFWQKLADLFMEWYFGSQEYEAFYNKTAPVGEKPAMRIHEKPLVDRDKLKTLLTLLSQTKTVGIGTGRQDFEVFPVLSAWEIDQFFDRKACITYTNILGAIQNHPGLFLSKPHPYIFAKGASKSSLCDEDIIAGAYDKKAGQKTLAIGDAFCDLASAKNAGCDFLAVLTGPQGKSGRDFFEKNGADYIVNSVLDLLCE